MGILTLKELNLFFVVVNFGEFQTSDCWSLSIYKSPFIIVWQSQLELVSNQSLC